MHETLLVAICIVLNLACVVAAWYVACRYIAWRLDQFEAAWWFEHSEVVPDDERTTSEDASREEVSP